MIEPQHEDYFNSRIKPHIDGHQVEYLGLLSQAELAPFYRKAACVLFLISWCEPFGLVAVEAQASGTPIIATRFGALPEIIVEGETGSFFRKGDARALAVATAEWLERIEREGDAVGRRCRAIIETRYNPHVQGELINAVIEECPPQEAVRVR